MENRRRGVDCIYVAASELDFRYTRICVASVRHFYPEVRLRLLAGGALQPALVRELRRYWDVDVAPLPPGNYGWGFVKLEPLFGNEGDKFLVLDSDTVMAGPVLETWASSRAAFLVDDERQSDADTKRLYYDWRDVREADPGAAPPEFLFNTGQWFGTAGALCRDDFSPWIDWSMPRRLLHRSFMCGEQGLLNFVLNKKAASGSLAVERRSLMRWPGHSMQGLETSAVANRAAPPLVVHWAGIKKIRLGEMIAADLLRHFEDAYYRRLPLGGVRRALGAGRHVATHLGYQLRTRARQRYQMIAGGRNA